MTDRKPSSHGIVVEHKDSKLRYASHDRNFDPKSERYVRDLLPGESVLSYPVKGVGMPDTEFIELEAEPGLSDEEQDEDLETEGTTDTPDGQLLFGDIK